MTDLTPRVLRQIREARERIAAERERIAAIKDRATPPEAMAAAPVAPARGTMRLQETHTMLPGGTRRRDGAHWAEAHALDAMNEQARLRHMKATPDAPFIPPFGPGQVQVAADYRALVEWREGTGIKCSSVEARSGSSGGSSGLFIDTFIDQGRFLDRIRARIGSGNAMEPQRASKNDASDAPRSAITARRLVDAVVIEGSDLTGVLRAHGWPKNTANIRAIRDALCAALDRMQGYRDE
jgi:hypothetical protein